MGTRRRPAVILWALLPWVAPAGGRAAPASAPALRLCIHESPEERSAAALLARFLSTVRLELAAGARCEEEGEGSYVGHFDVRGPRVSFVVRAESGQTLVRSVPWIAPSPSPLASLAAADRLSEFSILVDGVLAEDRSAPAEPPRAAVERPRPPPHLPVRAPAPAPPPVPDAPELEPPGVVAEAPLAEPVASPPAPPPAPVVVAAASTPEPPPPAPPPAPPPSAERAPAPVTPAAAIHTAAPARGSAPAFSADGWVSWIRRAPDLSGVQLGATVGWHRWFARGALESADWQWQARPIAFRALGVELGARFPLLTRARWLLQASAALLGERLVLRRQDVTGAADHAYWDAGASAGAEGLWRPLPWLRLSLLADAAFRPTERQVVIPGGPSVRVNTWSVRAGLAAGVAW